MADEMSTALDELLRKAQLSEDVDFLHFAVYDNRMMRSRLCCPGRK